MRPQSCARESRRHVHEGSTVTSITVAHRSTGRCLLLMIGFLATLFAAAPAVAQSAPDAAPPSSAASAVQQDDDGALDRAEPDFVVVNLPTTLRLPLYRSNFRLTHRFAGNL